MLMEEMLGQVFNRVIQENEDGDTLTFHNSRNSYQFFHAQECCESVYIAEIHGELSDLQGAPLLQADEEINTEADDDDDYGNHTTWTFYKFATIKGSVTVRWCRSSNGYYSEAVNFTRLKRTGKREHPYGGY